MTDWKCLLGLIVLVAGLATVGAAAADRDAASVVRQLESGSLEERIEAARWLGLNLVEEGRLPLLGLLSQPAEDDPEGRLSRTARLMYDLLRDPDLLRFRTPEAVLAHLEDADSRTRADAVRHTAYFQLDDAEPRVVGRLDDESPLVREEALIALGMLSGPSREERVLRLLDDAEGAVRLRAFQYLYGLERAELIERLVVLIADPSPWVAQPVARTLATGDHAERALDAALARTAACEEPQRTVRYLDALGRFGEPAGWPEGRREILRPLLSHEDEGVRLGAALLLVEASDGQARAVLEALLDSADAEHRARAVRGLVELEIPADSATAARLLDDPDPRVRRSAVSLAATLPPKSCRRLFLDVLARDDEQPEVLSMLLTRFPEIAAAADSAIVLRIARETDSDFLRINAVTALARMERRTGVRAAHEWYREVLVDPATEPTVKQAVLVALELVGDPSYLPELADQLRACPEDDVRYAVALSKTISVLVGRQLHGADFGEGNTE